MTHCRLVPTSLASIACSYVRWVSRCVKLASLRRPPSTRAFWTLVAKPSCALKSIAPWANRASYERFPQPVKDARTPVALLLFARLLRQDIARVEGHLDQSLLRLA